MTVSYFLSDCTMGCTFFELFMVCACVFVEGVGVGIFSGGRPFRLRGPP